MAGLRSHDGILDLKQCVFNHSPCSFYQLCVNHGCVSIVPGVSRVKE